MDLAAARQVMSVQASVFAMLLQMGFEKLAKAALLRSGAISLASAKASHKAASRMIAVLRRQGGTALKPLGGPHAWFSVFALVEELERAHPSLARGGPQLEYPWEGKDGSVEWPERHLPVARRLADPNSRVAQQTLDFADQIAGKFDELFPED